MTKVYSTVPVKPSHRESYQNACGHIAKVKSCNQNSRMWQRDNRGSSCYPGLSTDCHRAYPSAVESSSSMSHDSKNTEAIALVPTMYSDDTNKLKAHLLCSMMFAMWRIHLHFCKLHTLNIPLLILLQLDVSIQMCKSHEMSQ